MSTVSVEDLPKFARRLKSRREELKLTPTEVAKRCNMSLATLCNIEEARHLPSLPKYRVLCRVLRVSPGKLLER